MNKKPHDYLWNDDTGRRERVYRVVFDKLGDPIRIYRAVHIHRPGAGFVENQRRKEATNSLTIEKIKQARALLGVGRAA